MVVTVPIVLYWRYILTFSITETPTELQCADNILFIRLEENKNATLQTVYFLENLTFNIRLNFNLFVFWHLIIVVHEMCKTLNSFIFANCKHTKIWSGQKKTATLERINEKRTEI